LYITGHRTDGTSDTLAKHIYATNLFHFLNWVILVKTGTLFCPSNIEENTWKVLKCGAGEGWRRSVGTIM
jgi:hypothetical protein